MVQGFWGESSSGLYAARQRRLHPKSVCALSVQAERRLGPVDSYGSRRLSAALKVQGLAVGRQRARTLMRSNGLRARWRRKFVHHRRRSRMPVAANVLARQFNPQAPNRAWVGDITYIRTRSGWLYLAVVLDLFSRRIVGLQLHGAEHACPAGVHSARHGHCKPPATAGSSGAFRPR